MTVEILMVVCGLITHFAKDMGRIFGETKVRPTPWSYWKDNPYQTVLCLVGAIVGFVALTTTGQLTPLTAFGVGYMANSVADTIGKRSLNKV